MSKAIDNLNTAMQRAASIRPKVGRFPYLAEGLRQAGVTRNIWSLPTCQSLYLTAQGRLSCKENLLYRALQTYQPLIINKREVRSRGLTIAFPRTHHRQVAHQFRSQ